MLSEEDVPNFAEIEVVVPNTGAIEHQTSGKVEKVE